MTLKGYWFRVDSYQDLIFKNKQEVNKSNFMMTTKRNFIKRFLPFWFALMMIGDSWWFLHFS